MGDPGRVPRAGTDPAARAAVPAAEAAIVTAVADADGTYLVPAAGSTTAVCGCPPPST